MTDRVFDSMFDGIEEEVNGNGTFEELQDEAKKVASMARACINTEAFQQYRAEAEKLKVLMIDQIIYMKMPDGDLTKYGAMMLVMTERVRSLCSLLKSVETDAGANK